MTETAFLPQAPIELPERGQLACQSPSNIALVKYWGKHGDQLPCNTSISFTLSHCHTQTRLIFEKKKEAGFSVEVWLAGERTPDFEPKILQFFNRIGAYVPFVESYHFRVETENSFPHSSGIASSASGMSALALALVALEQKYGLAPLSEEVATRKASFLARLGSGSASRSLSGPVVVWGEHAQISGSSDLYGIPWPGKLHPVFENYGDTILIVDAGPKTVSSSAGHDLMHNHPFAAQRFEQAQQQADRLQTALEQGDVARFIEIVELEALTLHAIMMTSQPYYLLMRPATLQIIQAVWQFRRETGSRVCFTLDAGANVHLLYPSSERETVTSWIQQVLSVYCENGQYITDQLGSGAVITEPVRELPIAQ